METPTRSIVKAILWQIMGLLIMLTVGFWLSGSIRFGGQMAAINTAIGLVNYLIYERIWSAISWGRRLHHQHGMNKFTRCE
ncbi:MAG: DUF2061 domain-containing protein [Rhodobacteraceae bacterium]|nr:DUF2061 domain-containing protein [Paracoccaceae bacterium]